MFVSSYAHAASAAGDKLTGKRRYKSVPPVAHSPTTKTAGTDIGMQRPHSCVTDNLKVSNLRAIRLSYCCLVRTAMGRVMFDQGWGCIIPESTVLTFAPNQMLPVYYIHYDNRQIPLALAVCPMCQWWLVSATGHLLCQMVRWLTVSTMHALTWILLPLGPTWANSWLCKSALEMTVLDAPKWREDCNNGGITTTTTEVLSEHNQTEF